jgi:putative ABC transport system permease protein
MISAVLLRTIPFPDPGRVVRLVQQHTGGDVTIPEYQFVQEHGRVFSSVAAFQGGGERRLDAHGTQTWVTAPSVRSDFLRTLRMPPRLGREFSVEDTRLGGPQAVVLSDAVWRASFGADARVLTSRHRSDRRSPLGARKPRGTASPRRRSIAWRRPSCIGIWRWRVADSVRPR